MSRGVEFNKFGNPDTVPWQTEGSGASGVAGVDTTFGAAEASRLKKEAQAEVCMAKPQTHTICLFLPTGKTFTFRNAFVVTDNETTLVIDYKAMSDGLRKIGNFQKTQIVGYSTSPY